ncbi:MAG: pyruvate kinase [Chlamydiales bacterium]
MVNRTKIICTIGPAVATFDKVEELVEAGMNVARINLSHGNHQTHQCMIRLLKEIREKKKIPLAIMLDTKGPEIRLGHVAKEPLMLKAGSRIRFVKQEVLGDENHVTLSPPSVFKELKKEMFILLNDGSLITHVIEIQDDEVLVEVDHGGEIRSTRGVNIPGVEIDFPLMTKKDIEDIHFGCAEDIDLIAASFIRSSEHVCAIKSLLKEAGKPEISVIAKIENSQGIENFESIAEVADGIMVARGDLGVEISLTHVPRLQKMMIGKCYLMAKPSVTATQMLESMIKNFQPTRAEVSDIANAIYDSTSAVMLSGETAIGDYPIEAVKVMQAIIQETEEDFSYYEFFKKGTYRIFFDVPSSVAQASIHTAYSSNAKAIFAFTKSGATARLLSSLRPKMPIIAMTPSLKVYHQLSILWGVIPILSPDIEDIEEAKKRISLFALNHRLVDYGDLVVISAGTLFGKPGSTNMMIVDRIGEIVLEGYEGAGHQVSGRVIFGLSDSDIDECCIEEKILLIHHCSERDLPLLKKAKGVIMEKGDLQGENYLKKIAKELNFPYILYNKKEKISLNKNQLVVLDPPKSLVYQKI